MGKLHCETRSISEEGRAEGISRVESWKEGVEMAPREEIVLPRGCQKSGSLPGRNGVKTIPLGRSS